MTAYGLTLARTMGPIAEAVTAGGGSLARVFARADMPLSLLDTPDRLVLLRDQIGLVEAAMREIGDPALPARLSTRTGIAGLGPIGLQVGGADTLAAALARVEQATPLVLQTATWTGLRRRGDAAFYGYAVTERIGHGRQANEILALGYLLGTVRRFLGPAWRPERAVVTGATLPAGPEIEALFGCEVGLGAQAGLVFPAPLLAAPNPARQDPARQGPARQGPARQGPALSGQPDDEPIDDGLAACVAHLIELALDEARPGIDAVARRLGLSRRTLQRRLEESGTRYADIQRRVLTRRAEAWLAEGRLPIGRIALELGYADPAHFSRAFLDWTGMTPRQWRRGRRDPER